MRSICRASSFEMSAATFGISSFYGPEHVELHQLLEGDGRVEVFARQPQRLMQPLEDHLHPEGQLLIVPWLHVSLCSLGQARHARQLAEKLGERLLVGDGDLVAVDEPGEDRVVRRIALRRRTLLLARRWRLARTPAGERVVQIVRLDVVAPLARTGSRAL